MSALVASFDPDAAPAAARTHRAAFALYRHFIRDDARAEERWGRLKDSAKASWLEEAEIALDAADRGAGQ